MYDLYILRTERLFHWGTEDARNSEAFTGPEVVRIRGKKRNCARVIAGNIRR